MRQGCLVRALTDHDVELDTRHFVAARAVQAIYDTEWGSVGGPLHVVIDDDNVDDEFLTEDNVRTAVDGWKQWNMDLQDRFVEVDALTFGCAEALRELPTEADRVVAVEFPWLMLPPVPGTILHLDDNHERVACGAAVVGFMTSMPWRTDRDAAEFLRPAPPGMEAGFVFASSSGLEVSVVTIDETWSPRPVTYERVTVRMGVQLVLSSRWPRRRR